MKCEVGRSGREGRGVGELAGVAVAVVWGRGVGELQSTCVGGKSLLHCTDSTPIRFVIRILHCTVLYYYILLLYCTVLYCL